MEAESLAKGSGRVGRCMGGQACQSCFRKALWVEDRCFFSATHLLKFFLIIKVICAYCQKNWKIFNIK